MASAAGKGERADQLLVERGLSESRSRAQALIMAGLVFSDTVRVNKPGSRLAVDAPLSVRGRDHPWVSRGGLKLEKGLSAFQIDPGDMIAADIGASTGGFTDVLLHHGARRVFAVDVGHGQLAWKLRQDDRVAVLERTNARTLSPELISDPLNLIVCDASFIGLRVVLPAAMALAAPGAWLVALIKPQFEVGRGRVGKGGVVRDPELHQAVCDDIEAWLNGCEGWQSLGVVQSPITGPEGNVEFLIGGRYDH
jgi:23S rRNA (cytidine1920-2'-O)/16S rRNA (cytidine1409-2'-O)-methyltransferase